MVIQGSRGVVRVDLSIAYRLGPWSCTPQDVIGDRPMIATAQIQFIDQFWSTQEPMELCLQMGEDAWWCWQRVTLRRDGSTVVATMTGVPVIRGYLR